MNLSYLCVELNTAGCKRYLSFNYDIFTKSLRAITYNQLYMFLYTHQLFLQSIQALGMRSNAIRGKNMITNALSIEIYIYI